MADTATASATIKTWFETGDVPTQQQFADFITSYSNLVDNNALDLADTSITAFAGGGQGSAYQITKRVNQITTAASAGDSVKLPAALVGREGYILNATANRVTVYPSSDENFVIGATNAFVNLMPGYVMRFYCTFAGQWLFELISDAGQPVSNVLFQTVSASLTPVMSLWDTYVLSAQNTGLTVNAPTSSYGTGQKLYFMFKDNNTSRAITWNGIYRGVATPLPVATVAGKWMYFTFTYNEVAAKWELMSLVVEGQNAFTEAYLMISQSGTSNPTITVLQNNTGLTFTALRDSAGIYEITPSSFPTIGKTFVTFGNNAVDAQFVAFNTDSGDVFWTLNTFLQDGTNDDNILDRFCLHIRIFP